MVDATVFKTEVLCGACGFESHCGHHVLTSKESAMTTAREQMKMIDGELARIRSEIEKLKAQEEVLMRLQAQCAGEPAPTSPRRRSPNIKPLVLDVMQEAGWAGRTSAEVAEIVRERVPTVAKDTVGSVLSRLKSDGALTYDGERYYVKEFAPKGPSPLERQLRAVWKENPGEVSGFSGANGYGDVAQQD
jgi:hypothetical protein